MTPSEAKDLMGFADNCFAQINDVGLGRFRVNIFEKTKEDDSVVFKNRIIRSSYFVLEDGIYIDKTLR